MCDWGRRSESLCVSSDSLNCSEVSPRSFGPLSLPQLGWMMIGMMIACTPGLREQRHQHGSKPPRHPHLCLCVLLPSSLSLWVIFFSFLVRGFYACQLKSSSTGVQRPNSETTPPHPNATVWQTARRRLGAQGSFFEVKSNPGYSCNQWVMQK